MVANLGSSSKNSYGIVLGSHSYTDYVSNWNDMSCTMWATLNALLAMFPMLPSPFYGVLSGLNAIAPTFSLGVCGAFWLLLPPERQSKDIVSLHQHAFLAIITVVDLLLSGAPVRFFHILSTWVFAGAYALNTMIVYYAFGKSSLMLLFFEFIAFLIKNVQGMIAMRSTHFSTTKTISAALSNLI